MASIDSDREENAIRNDAIPRLERGMPALQFEPSLRARRELQTIMGIETPATPHGRQLADGFVRLLEKAILEYAAARDQLLAYLRTGEATTYHRAQDHFESFVQSLHRAIVYVHRMRRMGFRLADGSVLIPKPKTVEVLGQEVKTLVGSLRNRLEHLDEDILGHKLAPHSPVAIHLGWEAATIGSISIRYADCVRWMEPLRPYAEVLSRIELKVSA